MKFFRLCHSLVQHRPRLLLVLAGLFFTLVATTWCLVKYHAFGDNALDLAIFTQVIKNSAAGHLFAFGIHPHSYLGDHIDFSLLALVPLWWIAPHPQILLIAQVFIAISVLWPLSCLAQKYGTRQTALGIGLLFLATPFVHNVIGFEFHTLVFALPLLFFTVLAYHNKQLGRFFIFSFLTLLIREDLGLVILGFGLLALLERRSWSWWLVPALAGTIWFVCAVLLTGHFNHDHYKFLAYYGWLGATPAAILAHLATHPWELLVDLVRIQNILFVLVITLLFGGLPILGWRRLVPFVPFLFALFLTGFGGDEVTLRTHYTAVVLPFVLWATLEGYATIRDHPPRFVQRLDHRMVLTRLLLCVTTLYGLLTLSPFGPAGIKAVVAALHDPHRALTQAMVRSIPDTAHVVSSFATLPNLANRPELYSLHYVFSGKRQLSTLPYALPDDADWILYDTKDYLLYAAQFGQTSEKFTHGDDRLRAVLRDRKFGMVAVEDSFLLFQKNAVDTSQLYTIGSGGGEQERPATQHPNAHIQLVGIGGQQAQMATTEDTVAQTPFSFLPITLSWQKDMPTTQTYMLRFLLRDDRGTLVYEDRMPVAYGLFPVADWELHKPVSVAYRFLIPNLPHGRYTVQVQMEKTEGYLSLDPKLSAQFIATKPHADSDAWTLGTLER